MKKSAIILGLAITATVWMSCGNNRNPGHVYMPDMAYSVAVETYSSHDKLKEEGINYTSLPVPGTVARGDMPEFPLPMDKPGDSSNYVASKGIPNPLPALSEQDMTEAQRLYLVNCGICHGTKLDGNGPLWKGGDGPYPAAPKNLVEDPIVKVMPDGQMFYSITYGKNLMGSYASQLSTKQRWMVIHYIKSVQAGGKTATPATDSTATAAPADSTAMAK